jgi:uncharacterized membrane protein (UPF0182 family)
MAAKCDPGSYGGLIAYDFPGGKTVFGPAQVMARANQDTTISGQLTLWGQQKSSVVRGNMLAIPINNSILYVEPLYIESTTTQIPEFKRVIVSLGDRLVMEPTLQEAFASLMGGATIAAAAPTTTGQPATPAPGGVATQPVQPSATTQALVRQANEQYDRAQAAQRRGDWAAYGREIDALKQTLRRMQQQR